jgi:ATP-dependent protease ClpP protease subunit
MTTQYFLFTAPINQLAVNVISSALVEAINDESIADIYLGLSTGGGGVTEGIALHNLIKANPKPITIHGIGNIDSIGITVMLGAKTRHAVPASRFFFHPLGFDSGVNVRYDVSSLTARLNGLTSDQNRLKAIYKANTKILDSDLNELFEHEYMHGNAWAIQQGFIDGERDFFIPALARIRNLSQ